MNGQLIYVAPCLAHNKTTSHVTKLFINLASLGALMQLQMEEKSQEKHL